MEMRKKALVVQSNSLIQAKHSLSAEEQKIIKILISQIQKDDEDFKEYEFRIKDLAELLGMAHSNTYGVLREITKRLISRVLEFHNSETNRTLQASWLSSAEYLNGEGTVVLSFDPKLKPLLLQLKACFTKYELEQVLRFKGQYTIRFFELRKMHLGQNQKKVFFELEKLYWILGLGKDEYKAFKDFKRRVLKPAQLELLEKTGGFLSWKLDKRGRGAKIHGIWLIFDDEGKTENTKQLVQSSDKKIEEKAETQVNERNKAAIAMLTGHGISSNVAEELANKYDESYLQEKISLANAHPEYVKNKAGFLVQAIRENWIDDDIIRMRQAEMRSIAEKEALERFKYLEGIWNSYRVKKDAHGLREYEKRTTEEREALKQEFLGSLKGTLRDMFRKKESIEYRDGFFKAFFLEKLQLPNFAQYLATEGVAISDEDWEIVKREGWG
jgi:plasmid replication initiation protein